MSKAEFHERTNQIIRRIYANLKRLVESFEISQGSEEGDDFVLETTVRSLVMSLKEFLDLIGQIKTYAIVKESEQIELQEFYQTTREKLKQILS